MPFQSSLRVCLNAQVILGQTLKTIIIRHARENRKKCTLTPLETRPDFLFISYPFKGEAPSLEGACLLTIDAPLLSSDDRSPLCLIDGTWNLAAKIEKKLPQNLIKRSLPNIFKTAYPRKQTGCIDPERGLASIEALFVAYQILGWPTDGLLDHYYWANDFLMLNGFVYKK